MVTNHTTGLSVPSSVGKFLPGPKQLEMCLPQLHYSVSRTGISFLQNVDIGSRSTGSILHVPRSLPQGSLAPMCHPASKGAFSAVRMPPHPSITVNEFVNKQAMKTIAPMGLLEHSNANSRLPHCPGSVCSKHNPFGGGTEL